MTWSNREINKAVDVKTQEFTGLVMYLVYDKTFAPTGLNFAKLTDSIFSDLSLWLLYLKSW